MAAGATETAGSDGGAGVVAAGATAPPPRSISNCWRMTSSCSAISRSTAPPDAAAPDEPSAAAAAGRHRGRCRWRRRSRRRFGGEGAVEVGGESVDRRELLQQLAERDLHVERLLEQERRLGEERASRGRARETRRRCRARRVHARQIGEQASQAVDQGVSSSGRGCVGWVACDWHLILVTIVVDSGVGTARYRFVRRRDPPSGACARKDRSEAGRGACRLSAWKALQSSEAPAIQSCPAARSNDDGPSSAAERDDARRATGKRLLRQACRAAVPARPRASPAPDPPGAARSPSRSRTGRRSCSTQ